MYIVRMMQFSKHIEFYKGFLNNKICFHSYFTVTTTELDAYNISINKCLNV